jgi:hypothetical protein
MTLNLSLKVEVSVCNGEQNEGEKKAKTGKGHGFFKERWNSKNAFVVWRGRRSRGSGEERET